MASHGRRIFLVKEDLGIVKQEKNTNSWVVFGRTVAGSGRKRVGRTRLTKLRSATISMDLGMGSDGDESTLRELSNGGYGSSKFAKTDKKYGRSKFRAPMVRRES